MCGIAGYIFLDCTNKQFIDNTLLECMQSKIIHRGRDSTYNLAFNDLGIGFAHTRLSVQDTSSMGKQPMTDAAIHTAITYNGELYNNSVLRLELESLGYNYQSNTDTETILHSYNQWGIGCLSKFEGMFAFAILDLVSEELYLVRDRIGVKPLYFTIQEEILSFASEIKALWALPWNKKLLNRKALSHYLTLMAAPAPLTIYRNVYKIPAGYYLKIDKNKNISFQQWYSLLNRIHSINFDHKLELNDEHNAEEQVLKLLRESVKKRLISDVPIGVSLSGGLDSSLVVAVMKEVTDKINTFNVSFEADINSNEAIWARKVAKQFETNHHEIVLTEKDAFECFERMVYHHDEPLGDCVAIPLYYVSQLAKQNGVSVLLSGEGADELFCGYPLYNKYVQYMQPYAFSQKYIPDNIKKLSYFLAKSLLNKNSIYRDTLARWADTRPLFCTSALALSEEFKNDICINYYEADCDAIVSMIYPTLNQDLHSFDWLNYYHKELDRKKIKLSPLQRILYLELKHRLPELLLMRLDKMTMAAGVEAREPFLDHQLVEYALNLQDNLKFRNGENKYILKKCAERLLPHEIIYRKKIGFSAPTHHWFSKGSYFRQHFFDLIETKRSSLNQLFDNKFLSALYNNENICNADQMWVLQSLFAHDLI